MKKRLQIESVLHDDVKAEAGLAEGRYAHVLEDKTLFFPNGGFKRSFRNDVSDILDRDDHKFKVDKEVVEMHRAGLYDCFPELLFHSSRKPKQFKSVMDLRRDHQYNEEIEEETRRFFWPLDHFLTKAKCHIYAYELGKHKFNKAGSSKSLKEFWNIPSFFPAYEAALLCKIMPFAKQITMDVKWMEQTFELILGIQVKIVKKLGSTLKKVSGQGRIMGKSGLGEDSVIGNKMRVAKHFVSILLGPMPKDVAQSFSEGRKKQKYLGFLIGNFVPLDFEIEISVKLEPEVALYLEKESEQKSILGLTSVL
jgi:hypothetical protein